MRLCYNRDRLDRHNAETPSEEKGRCTSASGTPRLPFVAGRLGEFYVRSGRSAHAETVDAALRDLPKRVEKTGCASARETASAFPDYRSLH